MIFRKLEKGGDEPPSASRKKLGEFIAAVERYDDGTRSRIGLFGVLLGLKRAEVLPQTKIQTLRGLSAECRRSLLAPLVLPSVAFETDEY